MGNITLSRRVGIISQRGRGEGQSRYTRTVHQKLNRCFLTDRNLSERGREGGRGEFLSY